jgi:hypothetical protein
MGYNVFAKEVRFRHARHPLSQIKKPRNKYVWPSDDGKLQVV